MLPLSDIVARPSSLGLERGTSTSRPFPFRAESLRDKKPEARSLMDPRLESSLGVLIRLADLEPEAAVWLGRTEASPLGLGEGTLPE